MKLNYCPYDFQEIHEEKLAYELTFPKGWNWERVKKETVIGEQELSNLEENDKHKDERFRQSSKNEYILLKASDEEGGKSGLAQLLDRIEPNNESRKKKKIANKERLDKVNATDQENYEYDKDEQRMSYSENKKLECIKERNGCYTFKNESKYEIMYAVPCCPHCHKRLPIGWLVADDFGGISLMAPSGRGKTTWLLSTMYKSWEALKPLTRLVTGNDKEKINIATAHRTEDENDTDYYEMQKSANKMCRKGGECAQSTNREYWIPPVFLNIHYKNENKNKTLIIGIYDNSGENLSKMNIHENQNLRMLLEKMQAVMYLFDPRDLNIKIREKKISLERKLIGKYERIPIEEQGRMQNEFPPKFITGKEILDKIKHTKPTGDGISAALSVYDKYKEVMQQEGCLENLKRMYFMGVIIKSDLLQSTIGSNPKYKALFDLKEDTDMLDINVIEQRSERVQEMIKEYKLFGDIDIDRFRSDYAETSGSQGRRRRAVTWHCISALGCDTEPAKYKNVDVLIGDYQPIHVAEPLMVCILKMMDDKGWLKKR